eukprot:12763323-Ditylum_brightwellii.AAC.1
MTSHDALLAGLPLVTTPTHRPGVRQPRPLAPGPSGIDSHPRYGHVLVLRRWLTWEEGWLWPHP